MVAFPDDYFVRCDGGHWLGSEVVLSLKRAEKHAVYHPVSVQYFSVLATLLTFTEGRA